MSLDFSVTYVLGLFSEVRDCSFGDKDDNLNTRGGITLEHGTHDCTIEDNTFENDFDSNDISMHAVYINHDSYDNDVISNTVEYCSGSAFKVSTGSHDNTFDWNIIHGCGDLAYFISEDLEYPNNPPYRNTVINTDATGPDHIASDDTYDYYGFIRKFRDMNDTYLYSLYGRNDTDPENDIHTQTNPFWVGSTTGTGGNTWINVDPTLQAILDYVIGEDPAYVDFGTTNPIFRAETRPKNPGVIVAPTYIGGETYVTKFTITDNSRKPRRIPFQFITTEGDDIKRGDLTNWDGYIEKWLVENTNGSGWLYDIQGADESIYFANSNNRYMVLETMSGSHCTEDYDFDWPLNAGVNYKLYVSGATEVTMRPTEGMSKKSSPQTNTIYQPSEFNLFENYPNPFNPSTTIRYNLPFESRVSIIIFDINGRQVRKLVNDITESGHHSVVWDGTNDNGLSVPSATYICKFNSRDYTDSIKLLLLK